MKGSDDSASNLGKKGFFFFFWVASLQKMKKDREWEAKKECAIEKSRKREIYGQLRDMDWKIRLFLASLWGEKVKHFLLHISPLLPICGD